MQFIMGFESTYLWEDPIHSGIIFGSVLVTLISICYYSLISVVAYCSLTALLAVVSLKVYTYVMVTFLKKETPNPLAKVAGKTICLFAVNPNTISLDHLIQSSEKAEKTTSLMSVSDNKKRLSVLRQTEIGLFGKQRLFSFCHTNAKVEDSEARSMHF